MANNLLKGKGAHASSPEMLEGLDWRLAGERPAGVPHSIYQIVNHMTYWQDFILARLRGESPAVPEKAAQSWPGAVAPETEQEWLDAIARFAAGVAEGQRVADAGNLEERVPERESTKIEALAQIAAHNTYHLGQVTLLRRMLGSWPPPCGGDTW